MATRSKHPAGTRKSVRKAAAKAKAGAKLPDAKGGRKGRRTTVRVPATLEREISRSAKERGTTVNEALLHLAGLGAVSADRQRATRRLAERRRAAVLGGSGSTDTVPTASPQEIRDAILAGRDA